MLNLLKMDAYRFIRNKTMYMLLLLFCAFQIFGIFMMGQYSQEMEAGGGVAVGSLDASEFIQYTLSQPPSWMLLYITVFVVYFYMSEYQSGFGKNYMSMRRARIYTILAKIWISALFVGLLFLTMLVSDWIGRGLFFDNTAWGDAGYFVKLLIGQFLLHWAFAILMLCITVLCKNLLAGVIIGFVLALNIPGMLLGALESLVNGVNISQYWLVNTLVAVKDFNDAGEFAQTLLVAFVFIVLFAAIAVRHKIREDLN